MVPRIGSGGLRFSFCSPNKFAAQIYCNAARRKATYQGPVRKVNNTRDDFCQGKMLSSDMEKYQELIVPDLYKLNFMSIVYLDSEEADFLSTLIYGEN